MGNNISTSEEWVQGIFEHLSPRLGEFASSILSQQVEPLVQKVFKQSNVPNVEFKFTKLDFGDIPPKIENIKTHDKKNENQIILDFDLNYLGNCDLQVSIFGMESGVKDVNFKAKSRLVLKPTTKSPPFVGGFQFCFLNTPEIDYNLDGIADLIDFAPLKRKVRKELEQDIAKRCTYPNFYKVPMSSDCGADIEIIKGFEACGVLIVKLISAQDLAKKGGLKGKSHSFSILIQIEHELGNLDKFQILPANY